MNRHPSLKRARAEVAVHASGGLRSPRTKWIQDLDMGWWDWYLIFTAQGDCSLQLHGKSAACSWVFFSLESDRVPIPPTSAHKQGKVTLLRRPPCISMHMWAPGRRNGGVGGETHVSTCPGSCDTRWVLIASISMTCGRTIASSMDGQKNVCLFW